MFRIVFLILVAIGTMSAPAHGGWWDSVTSFFSSSAPIKPPKIKVLVVHDQQGIVVEVKGKYKLYDPNTGEHISTRYVGKRKYMQAVRDGLKWGEEFPGIYQLLIVPDETSTTTIVDGIEYHGPVFVYDIGGTISVVNEIPVEDFLSSTLAQRYKKKLPEEFLAALVIAARTNALYLAEHPKNQYWAVDARPANYQGHAVIDQSSDVEKAIKDTRYMVMSTGSGSETQPFPAEWKMDPVNYSQPYISKITFDQAEQLGNKGEHAAQILMKAFPGVKIEMIHSPEKK
jgi:stage II sporulation protein D